ncbi:MAG: VPS10 domain-containing protein [Flavicella sp.]
MSLLNRFFSHILVILFCSLSSYAQNAKETYVPKPKYISLFKTIPAISYGEPDWVHLLYGENPNYYQISDAFDAYYRNHPFVKTVHSQNLKMLSKIVLSEDYVQDDGSLYIPNKSEKLGIDARVLRSRKSKKTQLNKQGQKTNLNGVSNWTAIGPFETYDVGGVQKNSEQLNVYAFDQSKSNPNRLLAGTETAAVYTSNDKGMQWNSVGDSYFNDGAIREVKIAPSNPNIFYVALSNTLHVSMDAGVSWSLLLYEQGLRLHCVLVHPNNPDIIMIGGPKGLKQSIDGGLTWSTIFLEECWDLQFNTSNSEIIYLTKTNTTKKITEFLKSTDGGQTFNVQNNGWFEPIGGVALKTGGARIGLTDADSNRIYVVLLGDEDDDVEDNNFIGVYKSMDGGASWTTPYDGNNDGQPDNEPGGPYSQNHWSFSFFKATPNEWASYWPYNQGFYDLGITVSDTDPDLFMFGCLSMFKSEDGGTTYKKWGGYSCDASCGPEYRHPDIQDMEANGNDVWVATDGGLDLYDANFDFVASRKNGMNGSDWWGFGQGWNEDVLVGGRYHNGNAAYHNGYPSGDFIQLGGGETATGYVALGDNTKVYHSDIGGMQIPTSITGTVKSIPNYGMYPNESYVFPNRSEIVTDPNYWNVLYLGKDQNLWKSTDGGVTFELLHSFGTVTSNIVKEIEVSRVNTNLMFLTQKSGTAGKLWKSVDGGQNWTALTLPANHQSMFIGLNEDNELFLALNNGGNSNQKIYKSSDLGETWNNLTTISLNGERLTNVQVQEGTDGGVYITSNKLIWYKNNSLSDWQLYVNNLPIHFRICKLLPFYKKSKLRVAGNRGIWETDFYEKSETLPMPMTRQKEVCFFDDIQIDSHSVVDQETVAWEWEFPDASSISSTTVRNPIVSYELPGKKTVVLKITDSEGKTTTKTMNDFLEVSCDCVVAKDSDNDTFDDFSEMSTCATLFQDSENIWEGQSHLITNFDEKTSGVYYLEIPVYTNCYGLTATLKTYVDLDTNSFSVINYDHFGNVTDAINQVAINEIESVSSDFSKIGFELSEENGEHRLYFKTISNACGASVGFCKVTDAGMSAIDFDGDGTPNYLDTDSDNDGIDDYTENTPCDEQIGSSSFINVGEEVLIKNFGTQNKGFYFLELENYTNCTGATSTLKARIDLEATTFRIIEFTGFQGSDISMIGDGTSQITSTEWLTKTGYSLAKVNNQIHLYMQFVDSACGDASNVVMRLQTSCNGNLDANNNGVVDFLDTPITRLLTNNTAEDKSVKVSPNPLVSKYLKLHNIGQDYKLTLSTMQGKEVFKKMITHQDPVDLNVLPAGVYFYLVETETQLYTGKIILK